MSKHRVLSLKPQLRLERQGQDGQNEMEQPDHSTSLGDFFTSSTRIRFSVHTGVGARAAGRRAAARSAGVAHARADLRDRCDDLREAGGERSAHQPLEPARDCRRSDATRPGSEHLAALGGALFKKEADLKPHRFRYWLTPKPDPAFDAKRADICAVYKAASGADETHRIVSIDEDRHPGPGTHCAGPADGVRQGRTARV